MGSLTRKGSDRYRSPLDLAARKRFIDAASVNAVEVEAWHLPSLLQSFRSSQVIVRASLPTHFLLGVPRGV